VQPESKEAQEQPTVALATASAAAARGAGARGWRVVMLVSCGDRRMAFMRHYLEQLEAMATLQGKAGQQRVTVLKELDRRDLLVRTPPDSAGLSDLTIKPNL